MSFNEYYENYFLQKFSLDETWMLFNSARQFNAPLHRKKKHAKTMEIK